jgi:hypothetical protein
MSVPPEDEKIIYSTTGFLYRFLLITQQQIDRVHIDHLLAFYVDRLQPESSFAFVQLERSQT